MNSKNVLLVIVVLLAVDLLLVNAADPNRQRRHHRRHRQKQSRENSRESSRESSAENSRESSREFVPAFRAANVSITPSSELESSETSPNGSSMEKRVEHLEQYMRYLCLEDEEDIDRRIKVLDVKCICPKMEAPVCGSDNVTYYNRCFLHCRAQQAKLNFHRYRITLKKFGPC